jgi:hypothetical protein
MNHRKIFFSLMSAALVVAFSISALAQTRTSLRGLITDEFGAAIVGATVTLTDAAGTPKTATTDANGTYAFTALAVGKYKIRATASGFATSEDAEVDVAAGRRDPFNVTLKIAAIETQVKVDADTPLSTDTAANANQQVISGKDLDALPDDPDELAAALQALAGPSMGPNGGQIFVDGFTGGLPPKEAIREIRINQNPFSAENDQPSARIDILTRPGTDKFRGSASVNFTDESLNSRNPFAISSSKRAPYQVRQFSGNFSGPIIKKKASFFVDANRGETDDNDLLRATIIDENFLPLQIGRSLLVPRRNTHISPRLDYAINSNHTLVTRYNFFRSTSINGLGGFNLPSRAYPFTSTNHNFQVTETAILNAFTINETRFQFSRNRGESDGNSTIPSLSASASFNGGGAQVGQATSTRQNWELSNFTQMQKGMHTFKFGGRVRGISIDDVSPNNFGGSWVFTGGFGPQFDASNNPIPGTNTVLSSLERYRRTVLVQELGLTPAQQAYCGATTVDDCIRLLGGGAAQFSINSGDPNSGVKQMDFGFYFQDDWRVRPDLTVSYGVRYENQTNISSKFNFAPRIAFAWSPGAANATRPPRMVIRGGAGIFYERVSENTSLTVDRFDGTQVQFVLPEPFTPNAPPTQAQLNASRAIYNFLGQFQCVTGGPTNCVASVPPVAAVPDPLQTRWQLASNMQAPAMYLLGGQVERQLPKNITAYLGVSTIRRLHTSRLRDINAPLPGTISTAIPTGIRPDPTRGDINQYESSGKARMTQMFIGFNSRLSPTLSFSGNYVLGKINNDTDGGFPVNSYDLSGEWGRASFDVRHRFTIFGSYTSPFWKLSFNPFLVINSGPPFNITTGTDTNLDRQYNERPTFAQLNAYCSTRPERCTRFDYSSTSNEIIPRNYGNGPGSVSVNLRIGRTFGFGGENGGNRASSSAPASQQGGEKTAAAGDNRRGGGGQGGRGGPSIGGGMAGGARGGGGPQMMMMGGPGGGGAPAKYNLNVSLNIQNLLNRVNLSTPVGNLTSPNFGQSLGLGGGFGGFGGFGGGSSGAGNRRIYLNVRFSF